MPASVTVWVCAWKKYFAGCLFVETLLWLLGRTGNNCPQFLLISGCKRVDRRLLFEHLQGLGMPEELLVRLRNIYQRNVYVLVDGDERAQVEMRCQTGLLHEPDTVCIVCI